MRPEQGGGVRVNRLDQMLIPLLPGNKIFGIFLVFEVENLETKLIYTYQYFMWRHGTYSGSKGLVLVRNTEDQITHIIYLKGFSFAVGANAHASIGGFAEMDEVSITNMLKTVHREIEEELRISKIKVLEILNLGQLYCDPGMTPNHPALFAVIIDGSTAETISKEGSDNSDPLEMRSSSAIIPTSQLWGADGFLMKQDESYFLACICRLVSLGKLKPNS